MKNHDIMKRKRNHNGFLALFVMIFGVMLSSCDHKELCYHHRHIVTLHVDFDWRDAPEARPAGMCVFFYPADKSKDWLRFDFSGMHGGEIHVPEGEYRMLCYNNDTSGVLFSGEHDCDEHIGFTREGGLFEPVGISGGPDRAPRAPGAEDERITICPDEMWGCQAFDVKITEQGMSYVHIPLSEKDDWVGKPPTVTDQLIMLYPHELTCIYTYEILNVKNIGNISSASASISGMSPSLRFIDEELGRECITHPLDAKVEAENGRVTGRFITFGHHEENTPPHRMMLYVWTKDGKKYVYGTKDDHFDVTGQVHRAPDRRRVHLIIDGLDIPEPIEDPTPGEGFDPVTDEWQEVKIDVDM